ncbi:GFA family protein [Paraburkholderia sp. ZP32-5]|uniref:GFA family protein n=1 Tax=Paraburkholderia sp. ZP32-5 TaxID=2883245 RepID=UPI001F2C4DD7|nr:GFA family protein [Paraburkholderia sp. ZP32-5]
MKPLLAGRCLCGAVHYTVNDEFVYALNCHCSNCRRATGSAFKPFAGIERDKLRITQGEDSISIFGDERASHDVHCKVCGSLMFSLVRNGEYVHVTLGTLTDTPTIRPSAHIFVGSKAPWYDITDQLPQHDEFD